MIDSITEAGIERAREQYSKTVESTRANTRLTDDGRREQIAKAYLDARDQMDSLRAARTSKLASRTAGLERTLFGIKPTSSAQDVISARDAADRVDALALGDVAGLSALLDRAIRIGDTVLAKECLRRGWDERSDHIIEKYSAAYPRDSVALEQLAQLAHDDDSGTLAADISEVAFYLPPPPELVHFTEHQMEQLAFQADQPAATGNTTSQFVDAVNDAFGLLVTPTSQRPTAAPEGMTW